MRWYAGLRRSAAFGRARRRGSRANLATMRLFVYARASGPTRVGITVPREVGTAVVRNRVRRRIQGALDAIADGARAVGPADVVFVVQPAATTVPYVALAADVHGGLARLRRQAP